MSATSVTIRSFEGNSLLEFEKPMARIERQIHELEAAEKQSGRNCSAEIRELRSTLVSLMRKTYGKLTPWETVMVARHPNRPLATDYINMIVKDFCQLHGDRNFRDDPAIITGFGRMAGQKVMLVAHNKGKDTKEKISCCFGCAHPEGYRKALLKMRMAEKYNLPIVSLIDTPGAYPGIGAEERGQAQAIAYNLQEMSKLRVPIVCVVIGEGGSGGALGIGVGDRIAVMQHAYYSVISPEGCAAILFKTNAEAPRAAESLKMTARDLKKLGIIDEIVKEPLGAAHRNPTEAANSLERFIASSLKDLKRLSPDKLVNQRYDRWRQMGSFFVDNTPQAEKAATGQTGSSKSGKSKTASASPVTRSSGQKLSSRTVGSTA